MKENLKKYPVTVLFVLFILGGFIINIVTPSQDMSELENRYLAQLPSFSISSLLDNSYTPKLEEYVNDQFFMRDQWISLKSISEAMLLKIENNGISYGGDGYMFEKFTELDTDRYERNTGVIADFVSSYADSHNVTVMTVPSSYEVLPDNIVPTAFPGIDQLSYISDFYDTVTDSGGNTVDVHSTLTPHSTDYIYYKTDHHWTIYGAYLTYSAYMDSLSMGSSLPDSGLLHERDGFYGTYYSKAKLFGAESDVFSWYDVPVDSVTVDGEEKNGLYDLEKLDTRDMYAMFLWGNNGVTVIENENATTDKSILVLKDSYGNSFTPFLTENFSTVTVVDLRSLATPLSEFIAENSFDEILVLYSFQNLSSDVNIVRMGY